MRCYVNDLSIQGQFGSAEVFVDALKILLAGRASSELLSRNLFCSRALRDRPASTDYTVADAIYRSPERDFRILALGWLNKFGPFIENDRLPERDDLFQYCGEDVTDQGLGEAARRTKAGQRAASFSLLGGKRDFSATTLVIIQGFDDEPIDEISVSNFVAINDLLTELAHAQPLPESYHELLNFCRRRYNLLLISDDIERVLARETFRPTVRDGVIDILGILQEFMENRAATGAISERGNAILREFFWRSNGWFSDESDTNKRAFKIAMTFRDPSDERKTVTWYWHGKIQTPQFRVHFEWPVPIGQLVLKVAYIGPKISKG